MTKFDQVLNELTTNMNSVNPANQAQQQTQASAQPNTQVKPGTPTQTTTQTNQVNKPGQPATNNQQKPNLDQLMKDFNDPSKKINKLEDLKNYGINIDQK
jgi:hypothetical protein